MVRPFTHRGSSRKISVRHKPGLTMLTTTSLASGRLARRRPMKTHRSLVNWYRRELLTDDSSFRSARRVPLAGRTKSKTVCAGARHTPISLYISSQ